MPGRTDAGRREVQAVITMTTQAQRSVDRVQSRFAADLEARIGALFRRWPTLCGFSVRDAASLLREGVDVRHAGDVFVTEVSVYPAIDLEAPGEISNEIAVVIDGLLAECPGDCSLIRERTFARTFH